MIAFITLVLIAFGYHLTIKASEVESISLFYESMFRDFQAQDAKQEQSEIQAEN